MNATAILGKAARWCVRQSLRLYYPRIAVEGRERLPANGAVLLVANHPNSLMDPALIGLVAQRPVHFFAKAPLFDVPVFGALMHALGMVPAYRGQDDKAAVRKNLETLELGAQYLQQGGAVGIFPEGKTHDREGVEQVRTGAARIAWAAVAGGAATTIVPLGLNYARKERFRSAIWVRVGEPIDAVAWLHGRGEEERKAIRGLTEEIDRRLKQVVIHLNEARWQPLLDELEVLLPSDDDLTSDPIAALHQRKHFAEAMNHILATVRPRAETMAAAIEDYRAQLAEAGLTMNSPILSQGIARSTTHLLRETLWLLLGFVPALAGAMHHCVPFAITRTIVNLVKHPGRATIAQNRLMIGLPLYGIWYAVIGWLLASQTRAWIAWLWLGLMPFCGIAALHYAWRLRHAGRAWWHEWKMLTRPKALRSLRAGQVLVRRQLEQLREEYRARTG
jgi:glycerol-3-phosphate O-acyltransferase/dihydroxyacetone phosphate acyltransferase